MESTKGEEQLKYRIREIRKKCKQLKLREKDVCHVAGFKHLERKGLISLTIRVLVVAFAVAVVAAAAVGGVLYSSWHYDTPVTQEQLVTWYIRDYNGDDVDQETCMINMQDEVWDYTRAPSNCDFCRGLKEVPRVQNLSSEEFVAKYAYSGVPVVITDATDNWPAMDKFSLEFFRDIYTEEALKKQGQFCNFVPYSRDFGSLDEALHMDELEAKCHGRVRKEGEPKAEDGGDEEDGYADAPWYFGWGNCASSDVANIMRSHYSTPYFLPNTSEMTKVDWIFMGCPGYGANLHVDSVRKPSWQAMVAGTKVWGLEPPSECYFECEKRLEVTLNSGDLMIVDTNMWWHDTHVVGDKIAIAIGSEYD